MKTEAIKADFYETIGKFPQKPDLDHRRAVRWLAA
jgi:hypothetical protein